MATQPSSGEWDEIRREFETGGGAGAVLARRTALVDGLVAGAHRRLLAPFFPSGLSVLAVGGYGRRELFPYSDVDLLLLVAGERMAAAARAPIEEFLRSLWDSGLRLSHSVHTPEECTELDSGNLELAVSLLDRRYLGGDAWLYELLSDKLPKFVHAHRDPLGRGLARLARERHARFGNTIHHLEPDIKEAPGGLRDLQLLRWLGAIRSGEGPAAAPESLEAARRFLFHLRCRLHYAAGRDSNRLSFEAQEMAAGEDGEVPAAAWMRTYYRHARAVFFEATRALERHDPPAGSLFGEFRHWRSRLSNSDFTVNRERVFLREPGILETQPREMLRAFEFAARHGLRLSAEAERRIAACAARPGGPFPGGRENWPPLRRLLTLPHAALGLRAMHETGALTRLFPELEAVECLVIRDFHHRYTVDEHSLMAIQALEELPGRDTRFAGLAEEIERPDLLRFALLFHDVGKGSPGGSHIEGSLAAADRAMDRLDLPPADREHVRFLIRRHLDMPGVLRSRDLNEPATARYMAGLAETTERLKALTLVSYADLSAVNPEVMTAWRSGQLWLLYLATYQELTRELHAGAAELPEGLPPEMAEFLEGLPARYLRTRSRDEMERDRQLVQAAAKRGAAVRLEKSNGAYRAAVSTRDRPHLLASLAGALSSFGVNILKAEVFSNRRGFVLDSFVFSDPGRNLDLNPSEMPRLQTTLEQAALGKLSVKRLLAGRPKAVPPSRGARLRPSVAFDNDASPSATLIEIVAQDRPGLLYDLARTLSSNGCLIDLVLIDTEAHKAVDVFYVTFEGGRLPEDLRRRLEPQLREVCEFR